MGAGTATEAYRARGSPAAVRRQRGPALALLVALAGAAGLGAQAARPARMTAVRPGPAGGEPAGPSCPGLPQWAVGPCLPLGVGEKREDAANTAKSEGLSVGVNGYEVDGAETLSAARPLFAVRLRAAGAVPCSGEAFFAMQGDTTGAVAGGKFNLQPGGPAFELTNLVGGVGAEAEDGAALLGTDWRGGPSQNNVPDGFARKFSVGVYLPWQQNPRACTYSVEVVPMEAPTRLEPGTAAAVTKRLGAAEWLLVWWNATLSQPIDVSLALAGGGSGGGCSLRGSVIAPGGWDGPARWDGALRIGAEPTPLPVAAYGMNGGEWVAAFVLDRGVQDGAEATTCDLTMAAAAEPVHPVAPGRPVRVAFDFAARSDAPRRASVGVPFSGPFVFPSVTFGNVTGECVLDIWYQSDAMYAAPERVRFAAADPGLAARALLPSPPAVDPDARREGDLLTLTPTAGAEANAADGGCAFDVSVVESQTYEWKGDAPVTVELGPGHSFALVLLNCDGGDGNDCSGDFGFRVTAGRCAGALGLRSEVLPALAGDVMDEFSAGDVKKLDFGGPLPFPFDAQTFLFLEIVEGACAVAAGPL